MEQQKYCCEKYGRACGQNAPHAQRDEARLDHPRHDTSEATEAPMASMAMEEAIPTIPTIATLASPIGCRAGRIPRRTGAASGNALDAFLFTAMDQQLGWDTVPGALCASFFTQDYCIYSIISYYNIFYILCLVILDILVH